MDMDTRALLKIEFAYTTWDDSCKDPYVDGDDLRQCRRPKGHDMEIGHAAGYDYVTWKA